MSTCLLGKPCYLIKKMLLQHPSLMAMAFACISMPNILCSKQFFFMFIRGTIFQNNTVVVLPQKTIACTEPSHIRLSTGHQKGSVSFPSSSPTARCDLSHGPSAQKICIIAAISTTQSRILLSEDTHFREYSHTRLPKQSLVCICLRDLFGLKLYLFQDFLFDLSVNQERGIPKRTQILCIYIHTIHFAQTI